MNKFAKGAIATGVGVMLLVGGGGTLAVWNQSADASMGTVVAGDLNLTTSTTDAGKGQWTNAVGTKIDVSSYRVVPGDVLTYTQDLNVKLTGDLMKAKLVVTGAGVDGTNAFGGAATVVPTILTKGTTVLPTQILSQTDSGVVKASTTFTFKSTTSDRTANGASFSFSSVGYTLTQQAPATVPAVP